MTLNVDTLASMTNTFPIADVSLLQRRSLQKRLDQKYILSGDKMPALLEILKGKFHIIPTSNHHVAEYQTQYFDTKEYAFFTSHLRGKRPRHKVRIRRYPDRNLCMLECKKKNAADLTIKTSLEVPYDTNSLSEHLSFFDALPIDGESLSPSLSNTFHRITLLHKTLEERLTIDFNISFYTQDKGFSLDNCIIVERKRHPVSKDSIVHSLLRSIRAYPLSISKYCIGGYRLFNTQKNTLYRTKSRLLRKVLHDRTF